MLKAKLHVFESQIILKSLEARKPKGLKRIATKHNQSAKPLITH
jgi:hypothetical protein